MSGMNDKTAKTLVFSAKISATVFIALSLFLIFISVSNRKQIIESKIDIDKGLLSQSVQIGDLFFLKKYLQALVNLKSVEGVGIFRKSNSEILVSNPESFTHTYRKISRSGFVLPIVSDLNEDWQFRGTILVGYDVLQLPLAVSILIGLIVLFAVWRHQEELRAREILEIKDKIYRQVAHDIRSPIGALRTVEQFQGNDYSKVRPLISKVLARIEGIAADLYDKPKMSKIERLKLVEILKNIVDEKNSEFSNLSKNIKIGLNGDESIFANVNKIEFERVVSNIINNSVEAAADEVVIEITVKNTDKGILVQISDDGPGIAVDNINKVFDYQFSAGKKTGSGLGLYHARNAINKMNGNIAIENNQNKGARVSILLT